MKRLLDGLSLSILLFLYAPIAVLVLWSFNDAELGAAFAGLSLRWYGALWDDPAVWQAGLTSLELGLSTAFTSTILGTALALALRSMSPRAARATTAILVVAIVLPEIVMAVAMLRLFSVSGIELGFGTTWFAHLVFSLAYATAMVRARLSGMDRSLEEAAADLGAGPWTAFFTVTLPRLWPGIAGAALLVFTLSIDDYLVTSFVSGIGTTTLPVAIYGMVRKRVTPEINAICTVLLVFTSALVALAFWFERRRVR